MSASQGFPNTGAPFVDSTGRIQQPWLQMLIALWNRTGGSGGDTIIDVVLQQVLSGVSASERSTDLAFPLPLGQVGLPRATDLEELLFALALRRVTTAAGLGLGPHNTPLFAGLVGVADNSNAAPGMVGEFISSTVLPGSAVSLTTNVPADVTSIPLTAGDWDVWGTAGTFPGVTTTQSEVTMWTSIHSATLPSPPNNGAYADQLNLTTGVGSCFAVGQQRISLSTPTRVYLGAFVTFGVSTNSAYGFIGARRVR